MVALCRSAWGARKATVTAVAFLKPVVANFLGKFVLLLRVFLVVVEVVILDVVDLQLCVSSVSCSVSSACRSVGGGIFVSRPQAWRMINALLLSMGVFLCALCLPVLFGAVVRQLRFLSAVFFFFDPWITDHTSCSDVLWLPPYARVHVYIQSSAYRPNVMVENSRRCIVTGAFFFFLIGGPFLGDAIVGAGLF